MAAATQARLLARAAPPPSPPGALARSPSSPKPRAPEGSRLTMLVTKSALSRRLQPLGHAAKGAWRRSGPCGQAGVRAGQGRRGGAVGMTAGRLEPAARGGGGSSCVRADHTNVWLPSLRCRHASAGNRARVTSMATMYSATRPLML